MSRVRPRQEALDQVQGFEKEGRISASPSLTESLAKARVWRQGQTLDQPRSRENEGKAVWWNRPHRKPAV